ncbi:MAG: DUF4097 family beta strand repeat-containing protein [Gemmatimonadota bacterium]
MVSALVLGVALLAAPQQQTDTTFAVNAGGRLDVDLLAGQVRVESWERNAVRVRATHDGTMEVDIRHGGDVVRVEAEARRGPPSPVTFLITVPRSYGVNVDGLSAPVEVHNVDGNLAVETVNGPVTVVGGRGRLELQTTNGAVTVRGARGSVRAGTVNQGITLEDVEGDVQAQAVNGHISMQNVRARAVDAETVNGSVSYRGAIQENGRYRFSTHNGGVTLHVPAGVSATFSVATENGTFDSDFPVQMQGRRRGDRATFTLGSGSARVEMESFGGRIELRRIGGGQDQR